MNERKIITIPNILSFFRLCLIPVIAWLYCEKQQYGWALGVLVLSGATDILDGFIARRFNMCSDLGKVLDPVADKVTQGAVMLCLVTRYSHMLVLALLFAGKELIMGLSGIVVIRKCGRVHGALWHGKVTTALLYFTVILHILWYDIPAEISLGLTALCSVWMIISLVIYQVCYRKWIADANKQDSL